MSVESCNDQQVIPVNKQAHQGSLDAKVITTGIPADSPQMARKRLAEYFDVLIEMHREYKRNHKESGNEKDSLLQLKPSGEKFHKKPDQD